jgi:hypothetical protein
MSACYLPARLVLWSSRLVRSTLLISLLALVALAACVDATKYDAGGGDDTGNPSQAPGSCSIDADCVAAGATCCGCPTYAVPSTDPVARACADVDCPSSECAENVVAKCSKGGRCELACAPRACEQPSATCAYGFAADANGCLTCECAVPAAGGCTADAQCTRTRADCCGCQRGGFDTAVLVSDQMRFDDGLECTEVPACPDINTCTTDKPTCVQGRCDLVSPELPVGACGRADLPACPAGTVCVVNASDQANMHGVGVCGEPP